MYYLSKLHGNYYNSEFVEVTKDDSNQLYIDMIESGQIEIVESLPFEIEALEDKKTEQYLADIQTLYTSMFISALSRVTGKKGSKLELDAVREEYFDKYTVSLEYVSQQSINNQSLLDEMIEECERDFSGVILEQTINYLNATYNAQILLTEDRVYNFCGIVIFKYLSGEFIFKKLKSYCSYFRTACITDVEKGQISLYEQRKALAKSITNETSIEQIEDLVIQSKAL